MKGREQEREEKRVREWDGMREEQKKDGGWRWKGNGACAGIL